MEIAEVNDYAEYLVRVNEGQRRMYDAMQHKDYERAIEIGLEMIVFLRFAISAIKLEQENQR